MVILKEFFEKVYFEKNQQTTKTHEKVSQGGRVILNTKQDELLLARKMKGYGTLGELSDLGSQCLLP